MSLRLKWSCNFCTTKPNVAALGLLICYALLCSGTFSSFISIVTIIYSEKYFSCFLCMSITFVHLIMFSRTANNQLCLSSVCFPMLLLSGCMNLVECRTFCALSEIILFNACSLWLISWLLSRGTWSHSVCLCNLCVKSAGFGQSTQSGASQFKVFLFSGISCACNLVSRVGSYNSQWCYHSFRILICSPMLLIYKSSC